MENEIKEFVSLHPVLVAFIFFAAMLEIILKLMAMWRAARNHHSGWFVILAIINSAGILPIIYILLHRHQE